MYIFALYTKTIPKLEKHIPRHWWIRLATTLQLPMTQWTLYLLY